MQHREEYTTRDVVILVRKNSEAAETQHRMQCRNLIDSAALSAHHVHVVWWPVDAARRWTPTPSPTKTSPQDALIDGY